jgi:hypothetical protein
MAGTAGSQRGEQADKDRPGDKARLVGDRLVRQGCRQQQRAVDAVEQACPVHADEGSDKRLRQARERRRHDDHGPIGRGTSHARG